MFMLVDIALNVGHIAPAKGFKCRFYPRPAYSSLVSLSSPFQSSCSKGPVFPSCFLEVL